MSSSGLITSASGVRGIVGQGLTPEVVAGFCAAFGSSHTGRILVGYDTRPSGRMFRYAAFSGLMSVGCTPVDAGVCPTPSLQLAVRETRASGAILITGSHNPEEWNALKFVRPDGMFLFPAEGLALVRASGEQRFPRCPWDEVKTLEHDSTVIARHIDRILELVDVTSIRQQRFKVVIDACNGAGSLATPMLLEQLGCSVVRLNCNPDEAFPRSPEPIPANLEQLCCTVRNTRADIGFAHDADADRLTLVASSGKALSEEYTVALAAYHILKQTPGPVVVNMSTSSMVDTIAREKSCPVFRTPVGDVHVSRMMQRTGAVIGGEGNGGVIFPPINYARDGLAAATLLLELLAKENSDLLAITQTFPRPYMEKRKLVVDGFDSDQLQDAIRLGFPRARIDLTDGIRADLDSGWIHIRKSGTEPIVRVICESRKKSECQQLLQWALENVRATSA